MPEQNSPAPFQRIPNLVEKKEEKKKKVMFTGKTKGSCQSPPQHLSLPKTPCNASFGGIKEKLLLAVSRERVKNAI